MAKKVREQTVSLSSYLASVNSEDISENQDVQRMRVVIKHLEVTQDKSQYKNLIKIGSHSW